MIQTLKIGMKILIPATITSTGLLLHMDEATMVEDANDTQPPPAEDTIPDLVDSPPPVQEVQAAAGAVAHEPEANAHPITQTVTTDGTEIKEPEPELTHPVTQEVIAE